MEDQYEIVQLIKNGGFGEVRLAKDKTSGQMRALKKINSCVHPELIMEEVLLLTMLNMDDVHGFIVQFHGKFKDQSSEHHLVFELMMCDLGQWVDYYYRGGVHLDALKVLTTRMLGAFQYLESNKVVHGDVKPDNFLMASPDPASLKLCDFGLSRIIAPSQGTAVLDYPRTTVSYRAPEVILGYPSKHPQSLDMWGVGCVLMELTLDVPLFEPDGGIIDQDDKEEDVLFQQCKGLCKPPSHMLEVSQETDYCSQLRASTDLPEYGSHEPLLAALLEILHTQMNYSPSMSLCLHDFIHRFLRMDPDDRANPSLALKHPFLN